MPSRQSRIRSLALASTLMIAASPVVAQNVGVPLGMSPFDPRPPQDAGGRASSGQTGAAGAATAPAPGGAAGQTRSRVPAMTEQEMAAMGPPALRRAADAPGPIMFGPDPNNHGLAFLQASRGRDGASSALSGGRTVRLGVAQPQIRRGVSAYAIRIEGNNSCDERGCDTEIHMASGSNWVRVFRDYTSGLEITTYDASSGMARLEDQNGRRWEWDGRSYALMAPSR